MSLKLSATGSSAGAGGLRPVPPTSLKSSQLKLPPSSASFSGSSSSSTLSADDSNSTTINQDLSLISQKIADISGDSALPALASASTPASSTFVSGLRSLTHSSSTTNIADENYKNLEKLMSKIGELDRLVLKKTAPPASEQPARRLSRNVDLHHLPTHLHLIDRLMDLYNQSKRVTVIRTTDASGNSIPSTPTATNDNSAFYTASIDKLKEEKRALEGQLASLNSTVTSLQTQVKQQQSQIDAQEKASSTLKQEASALVDKLRATGEKSKDQERHIESCQMEITKLKKEVGEAKPQASAGPNPETEKEIITLKERLELADTQYKELESVVRTYQMKLKAEALQSEQIRDVLKAKAEAMRLSASLHIFSDSGVVNVENIPLLQAAHKVDYSGFLHLAPETVKLLKDFDSVVDQKTGKLCDAVIGINSVKDALESEMQSYQLERMLLSKDLASVQSELDALKGAYSALESENVNNTRKLLQQSCGLGPDNDSKKKIEELQETINHLQNELLRNSRRMLQYEKLPTRIAELELSISEVRSNLNKSESECEALKVELDAFKKLSQSLKERLRLGATSQNDNKGMFLDSFEEVLQEEMMTMKNAFETKLRLAKEEAEMASKRHLQEIQRMQMAAPGKNLRGDS